jgi:hypothetical protein
MLAGRIGGWIDGLTCQLGRTPFLVGSKMLDDEDEDSLRKRI